MYRKFAYILTAALLTLALAACHTSKDTLPLEPPAAAETTSHTDAPAGDSTLSADAQGAETGVASADEDGVTAPTTPSSADQSTSPSADNRPVESPSASPSSSSSAAATSPTTTRPATTTRPVTTTTRPTTTTSSRPATTRPTTPAEETEDFQQAILRLVNEERAKAGLTALVLDEQVSRAAQIRASEIITTFSHTRPDGTSCFTALDEVGIASSRVARAENIAAGQRTPEAVMESWMNSSGHRANILNPNLRKLGVGYAEGGSYRTNWVQMFTS